MKYEGEKFLLKLYRELYKEESVKHSGTKSDDKFELISKYLKRLESTEKAFTREKEGALNYLKNRYYDKYVIKEEDIPESYYQLQKKIALERGYGHLDYTDELKHKEANILIKEQQKSLDSWLNYLMEENTSYPMWARYWAFQGMLKLGKYDKEKGSFTRRSKGTASPFVELNAEALALSIETVVKYQQDEKIDDRKLEELVKSGNFGKIYAYNIWKINEDQKKNSDIKVDTTEGIWKEYKKGMHKELVYDIEGKGTGWCIAGAEVAKSYSENGKMHIYYTKDKSGNYTIPRICIREEHGTIAEVRGVDSEQNMESEMLEITERKLNEFPDKEEYKKKVSDMKKLTEIYNKSQNGEDLTKEELIFLYEVNERIIGFGFKKDPRIKELINKRDNNADIISLVGGVEVVKNGRVFKYLTSAKGLESLKEIEGDAYFENLTNAGGLENLQTISGMAIFSNLKSAKGLESLKEIGKYADFDRLTSAKGLENLEKIGGTAAFRNLISAEGLDNLREIHHDAIFRGLKSAKGLENLKIIGEDACFWNLASAEGLINLKRIGGNAAFRNLISAEGLENLVKIGGLAEFNNLTSAKGLENLQEIGGDAYFINLTSSKGLESLRKIGLTAYFNSLISSKGLENLEEIGRDAYFESLKSSEGLENLQKIGGDAVFTSLINANGLKNLQEIGWDACFRILKSAEGLENLQEIGGTAYFVSLTSTTGLEGLQKIGGTSYFGELENITEIKNNRK